MLDRILQPRARLALQILIITMLGAIGAGTALAATNTKGDHEKTSKKSPDASSVQRETLKNGLRVIVVPDRLAPTVTTVMNYDVGSRQAPKGFPGMAHAQEHMMFRGTDKLSAAQISAISAAMGGRFNANTQDETTQYYFSVPARYVDVALHLHAARMKSVADSAKAWNKERGAIEKEVGRDLSSPDYVAYTKLRQQLFAGTPYAHDALGTKSSFDKTTAGMLKKFHQQWYAPNNATLVVAGDVNPAHVLKRTRQLFGGIKPRKLPKHKPVELSPIKKPHAIQMPTDAGYGLAYVAFRTPGTDEPQQYAAARVLANILSNPRGKLYSRLVATGKSLGTEFDMQVFRESGIGYAAAAFPKGADSDKLVSELRGVLADIAKQGVTGEQVKTAKRKLATRAAAQRDSIPGLAMNWSQAVAINRMHSPQAELEAIRSVTAKQVNVLAKHVLQPKHSVLTVLTPQGSGAPSSSGGFGGKESFKPSHVANVELPKWAAKPLSNIEVPAQTVQPTSTHLKNGLRVITVPTDSTHAIHVYGHIRNQPVLEAAKGTHGVDSVLSRLLSFGTTQHDRVAYQAALDTIGAQASAGTSFSLTVLPEHFDRGLSLLAENERHPALPKHAFKLMRRQIAAAVAGKIASPDFQASQALKRALYPKNDPSLRHATPKSVRSLSYKQLKGYYQKVFRPDLATIVVVGDISPKAAEKAIDKRFGGWQAEGEQPDVTLPKVPANEAASIHVPDRAKVQDVVKLAETVDLHPSQKAYRALELGNQVLTGGFYASRLYRELRANRGLVYYIHSGLSASRTRTHLTFQYGANADKVAAANKAIRNALVRMAKAPVSAEELHRAKAGLIRQIPLDESGAGDIAQGLLSRVELDLPLDAPYRAARLYKQLGAKDVRAAFKKWTRPQDLVHVVQGPKPKS